MIALYPFMPIQSPDMAFMLAHNERVTKPEIESSEPIVPKNKNGVESGIEPSTRRKQRGTGK